jgi:hypothetical protein
MNWQVFSRPEAENDVIEIAAWYDSRREGLGDRFVEEFLAVRARVSTPAVLTLPKHALMDHDLYVGIGSR